MGLEGGEYVGGIQRIELPQDFPGGYEFHVPRDADVLRRALSMIADEGLRGHLLQVYHLGDLLARSMPSFEDLDAFLGDTQAVEDFVTNAAPLMIQLSTVLKLCLYSIDTLALASSEQLNPFKTAIGHVFANRMQALGALSYDISNSDFQTAYASLPNLASFR